MIKVNWLKIIKLTLLSAIVATLSVIGLTQGVYWTKEAEYRYASFERNNLDFYVDARMDGPSEAIAAQSFVNKATDANVFERKMVSDSATQKIDVLFAENLEEASDIGFFNADTLLKGTMGEGLYLDENAAKMLDVGIGDTVRYPFGNRTLEIMVTAIFLPCYIIPFHQGVGMLQWTAEHRAIVETDFAAGGVDYGIVLVDALDNAQARTYLEREYGKSKVTVLSELAAGVKETADYYMQKGTGFYLALGVSAAVLFAALGILLVMLEKKSDYSAISKGKKSGSILKRKLLGYAVSAMTADAAAGIGAAVCVPQYLYFNSYLAAIFVPILSPLVGMLVVTVFLLSCYKKMLERAPLPQTITEPQRIVSSVAEESTAAPKAERSEEQAPPEDQKSNEQMTELPDTHIEDVPGEKS